MNLFKELQTSLNQAIDQVKLTPSKYNGKENSTARYWGEWYSKKATFYFGFLPKGDYRLGVTLGNREACVDLIFFSAGYMR